MTWDGTAVTNGGEWNLLSVVAEGKFAGCKLPWLSDADLREVRALARNAGFKNACSGLLKIRRDKCQSRLARS
jgi:hypothetical protein